ncbi:uncharacterized protein LOC123317702 [Coccinella septempunctata]|uniref:uncharacterized protein LOC123317702 n=1 Tax=Coccinella septempunctata TaxID=41139 RepID=UPI001D09344D|nr:uncharacterized protein LOC123317702 [Coccinella septempunctata]
MFNIENCLRLIKSLVALFITTSDNEHAIKGIKECTRAIRKLYRELPGCTSIGGKQQLEAQIRSIKSLKQQFKQQQRIGAGLSRRKETAWNRVHWNDSLSAFDSRIRTGVISNLKHKEPKDFLMDCEAIFRRRILNALKKDEAVKVNMVFCGEFQIMTANKIQKEYKYFTTSNSPIYRDTNITEWFNINVLVSILKDLEEFQERDSGWALVNVVNLGVNINKFTPQLGSSYIELPPQIKRKEACINVKNDDEACFAWSVMAALHPVEKDPQRLSKYPHYSKILKCLRYLRSEEKLKSHSEDCGNMNETAIKLPEIGNNTLKFKNHKNKEKVPFIIYADLESILKPTNTKNNYQEHKAAAVGYYVKCSYDDSLSFYRSHRGLNCMKWFADEMNQFAGDVDSVFLCPYDIDMTPKQEVEFRKATHCHICEEMFKPEDKKVRDHNHLIPEKNYRGAAHEGCNINYKDSHMIPVVFHNLSGYDANFLIQDIATRMEGKIDLLPITKEKYISFTKHYDDYHINFRFIDSFRFMACSLDKLASYLEEFPNLKSQFPEESEEHISLLTNKGVMPYDYIDSYDRFDETSLPPIEAFYNKLDCRKCPRRRYERAQLVWNKFKCQNLGEYSDLYMKTDILLLADVFEQFRSSCHKTYGLDPAHYFTLPGYTWDAMLKYTKQELELLTDVDMFLFVERGIRGGLSQVCGKRRAHANNKYIPNYDSTKPENYLMYFDVNNQYGWAMSQCLPYGGFTWTDTNINVLQIPDDAPEGYILEVDLEYPRELHDVHKDLPFCPEHYNSKTQTPCYASQQNAKLMATLHQKKKYIIHYRNLKQALKNGLIITKIHRVLKFKQSTWLKSYIDLNTDLRKNAENEFEKNLFKLMNNAVFGKTMENIRKRVNVHLLTKWKGRYGAETYISKPEFKNSVIFNENFVAVEMRKLQIYLNKPIYVGMSILDLAKTTIYDFHYHYMNEAFSAGCTILYTDTDSLIYEVYEDPYERMKLDCYERFDTSDYPKNNTYGIPQVNKKVLGMMKDENNGIPMTDYVGLRSKLYAVKTSKDDLNVKKQRWVEEEYEADEIESMCRNYGTTKKAKGIKKSIVKNRICFDDYIECLETWKHKIISQNLIQVKEHHVYSLTQEKIALSPEDDKRCLVPGTFNTVPWGHYSLNKRKIEEYDEPRKKISMLEKLLTM